MPEKKIYTDLFLQALLPYTHINTFLAKNLPMPKNFLNIFSPQVNFRG